MNEHGWVPVKLYEFQMIFHLSSNYNFLDFFPPTIQKCQSHSLLLGCTETAGNKMWLVGDGLQTSAQEDSKSQIFTEPEVCLAKCVDSGSCVVSSQALLFIQHIFI